MEDKPRVDINRLPLATEDTEDRNRDALLSSKAVEGVVGEEDGCDQRTYPHYTMCQICINIFSIGVYIADIVTDALLAWSFFRHGRWLYFWMTVAFMTLPSFFMNTFSFIRYLVEDRRKARREWPVPPGPPPPMFGLHRMAVSVFQVLFSLLQLGPVLRYASAIYYGIRSRRLEDSSTGRLMYKECRGEELLSRKLRLFETAMEAGPQLVLQLYILLASNSRPLTVKQQLLSIASILTSWIGISWAHVSYYRSATHYHERHITTTGTIIYFLWRLFEVGPRVLSFSVFAEVFYYYAAVVISIHWLAVFAWFTSMKKVSTKNRTCVNVNVVLGNMLSAAVATFGFFDVKAGQSRYRRVIFYLVFYCENVAMVGAWFSLTRHHSEWFQVPVLCFITLSTLVSFTFQLIFYTCYHESIV